MPGAPAIALIAAGQSSSVTGTLAGQIVMEGYLDIKLNPFLRQILTRMLAIVPPIIVIIIFGESNSEKLLVFSQVVLSLQLSFAVIPLIFAVSSKKMMKDFKINSFTQMSSWLIAFIICSLNLYWLFSFVSEHWTNAESHQKAFMLLGLLGFLVLLFYTVYYPIKMEKK